MGTISFLVVLSCVGLALGDWPKKFDPCKENAIGFTRVGLLVPPPDLREGFGKPNSTISFREDPAFGGSGDDVSSEGVFTCRCRGTYLFTFTSTIGVKLCLKSRYPIDSEYSRGKFEWITLACGRHHTVLKYMQGGEQMALFLERGDLLEATAGAGTFDFTGFLLSPD